MCSYGWNSASNKLFSSFVQFLSRFTSNSTSLYTRTSLTTYKTGRNRNTTLWQRQMTTAQVVYFIYYLCVLSVPEAPAWFFQGWAMRGSEGRKSRSRVPGAASRWGPRGEAPRSWQHFLKMMHKYFVYWGFRLRLQQTKHFSTFPGAPFPAHACGVHDLC